MSDQPTPEEVVGQVWNDGVNPKSAIFGAIRLLAMLITDVRRIADALEANHE